jgi:hypothetical protein
VTISVVARAFQSVYYVTKYHKYETGWVSSIRECLVAKKSFFKNWI